MVIMCLLHLIVLSYVLKTCESNDIKNLLKSLDNKDVIENLNALQIIRKFGYPAEAHEVLTKDGYLLQMHRIPHGKHPNTSGSERKPPVLIEHGLLGSSVSLLLVGPEKGLPFLLSDLGCDVWFGNSRGNTYSRAHVNLTPDDKKFWNFSWHETGIYDVSAEIDFVREHTNQDKIIYIGFSMGTTAFFVLTSVLPEYNDKILVAHLMAPVAYVKHIRSPIINLLNYLTLTGKIKVLDEIFLNGEFLIQSPAFKIFEKTFCEVFKIEMTLCFNIIFLIVGFDPKQLDTTLRRRLLAHFPAGYSAKGVYHYSQLELSGKFRPYDYGAAKNKLIYGSIEPPDYKVEKIRTPMHFYMGKNDLLSTFPDIDELKNRLQTLKSLYVVTYPKFTHLDFIISLDGKKYVYDRLIQDMNSYVNNTNLSCEAKAIYNNEICIN